MKLPKQLQIVTYTRARKQGSWRYQKRGVSSLVARPIGSPLELHRKDNLEGSRREGALGARSGGNVIRTYTRADAEVFARSIGRKLMPVFGGEFGPWLTRSV